MADQDVPERVYALRGEDAVSFRGYDISANEWERLEGTRTVNAGSIVTYERNPNWLYAILADDEEYAWYYDRDRDDWESQTEVPLPRPCSSGSALANVDRVLYLAVAGEYSTGTTNFYTQTLDRDGGGGQSAGATHPHDGRTLVWLQSGGGIALRYRAQGQLEAAIHDLSGRSVRTLRQMASASGPTELYWDARDQTGTRVSPGVYFISAQDAEGLCRAKVTLP
jgi:hypothetical protein